MPELTNSTREAARRIGVSDTAIHKAERAGRIAREPDGQWDIDKTRRRLTETADPTRSPLAARGSAEGTPFARLKVAQLALKVEAQRLSLDETKRRLLDVTEGEFTGWVVAQAGSVVGVLVTGGDHQHPEAQNVGHAVDDALWCTRISHAGGEAVGDAEAGFDLA